MDKIFGELDFVDAGEQDSAFDKIEARVEAAEKDPVRTSHSENVEKKEEEKEEKAGAKREETSPRNTVDNPVV